MGLQWQTEHIVGQWLTLWRRGWQALAGDSVIDPDSYFALV